jgi:hypothetical protein
MRVIQTASPAGLVIDAVSAEADRLLIVARPTPWMPPALSAARDRGRFTVATIGA